LVIVVDSISFQLPISQLPISGAGCGRGHVGGVRMAGVVEQGGGWVAAAGAGGVGVGVGGVGGVGGVVGGGGGGGWLGVAGVVEVVAGCGGGLAAQVMLLLDIGVGVVGLREKE